MTKVDAERDRSRERRIQAAVVAAACALVLVACALVVSWLVRDANLRRVQELHEASTQYVAKLRRMLDGYIASNQHLAAFVGASPDITEQSFHRYVRAADPFRRLAGLVSMGYLPRVPAAELPAFEARMQKDMPGFRVWGNPLSAGVHYPLAYAINPKESGWVDELRGFDYASIIEREAAIDEAVRLGRPRATLLHLGMSNRPESRVVLLFTPVFKQDGPGPASHYAGAPVQGVVFSILLVHELFARVQHGLFSDDLDIEVFEKFVHPATLIYGDAMRGTGEHPRPPLVRRDLLDFAGVQWLVFLYQKHPPSATQVLAQHLPSVIIGILLSLLAGYVAFKLCRRYRFLAEGAWQAEKFAAFFNNHPFSVYLLDRERRFTAVNAHTAKELGVPREALVGMPVEAFLDPEDARRTRCHFEQAIQGQAVSYRTRVRAADGMDSFLSIVLVPITMEGKVSGILGIAQNITKERHAQEELHRSRPTLQLVLDHRA